MKELRGIKGAKGEFEPERILNRKVFLHFLDLEIKRARRYQNFVSVLLLKIRPLSDEFKCDLSSHYEIVARLLSEEMRETDLIGAMTEDKMVAMLPYANECAGEKAKGRIEKTLTFCDFNMKGCEVTVRSVCFPANVTNTADLLPFL